jgi:hypothetical protein
VSQQTAHHPQRLTLYICTAPCPAAACCAERGKMPTVPVAGCRRRLAPTLPPTVMPLRSSRAGVWMDPQLLTTTGACTNTRTAWLLLLLLVMDACTPVAFWRRVPQADASCSQSAPSRCQRVCAHVTVLYQACVPSTAGGSTEVSVPTPVNCMQPLQTHMPPPTAPAAGRVLPGLTWQACSSTRSACTPVSTCAPALTASSSHTSLLCLCPERQPMLQ